MFWVLIETVHLSTHNICFGWEIRKLFFWYARLTKGLSLFYYFTLIIPGHVAQLVASLTADSKGRELDPGPVPSFRGNWSWNNFYSRSPTSAESRGVAVCYKQKYVNKVFVNRVVKLAQEKCGLVNWPSRHDHSCWLGPKTSNQTKYLS